jgi:nucleotide-binding universal stress UspA family protein
LGAASIGAVARDMLSLSPVPVTVVKPPPMDDSDD